MVGRKMWMKDIRYPTNGVKNYKNSQRARTKEMKMTKWKIRKIMLMIG